MICFVCLMNRFFGFKGIRNGYIVYTETIAFTQWRLLVVLGRFQEFFLTVKCKFMPKGLDKYYPYNCCLELSLESTRSILMTYCHWKNWFKEFLKYLKCHLYFWNWTRNEMQFPIHLFKMVFRLVCHLIYKTNLQNRFYCASLWYKDRRCIISFINQWWYKEFHQKQHSRHTYKM